MEKSIAYDVCVKAALTLALATLVLADGAQCDEISARTTAGTFADALQAGHISAFRSLASESVTAGVSWRDVRDWIDATEDVQVRSVCSQSLPTPSRIELVRIEIDAVATSRDEHRQRVVLPRLWWIELARKGGRLVAVAARTEASRVAEALPNASGAVREMLVDSAEAPLAEIGRALYGSHWSFADRRESSMSWSHCSQKRKAGMPVRVGGRPCSTRAIKRGGPRKPSTPA